MKEGGRRILSHRGSHCTWPCS